MLLLLTLPPGAAASLKHAQAHDLPSFPTVGIDTRTSAGTAANLANSNFKSPAYPKAGPTSAAAGKAALLANGYKMDPLWQPEASAAGSKAALLAHKDGVKLNLWQPEPHAYGHSAATIAMSKKGLGPHADWSSTEDGRKKALIAATGATSETRRKRAQSHPVPPPSYPDSQNSAKNALSAATISHSASMRMKPQHTGTTSTGTNRVGSEALEAARIQHSKVSREMYTDRPPVALEVEEKKKQDALRASAISMAKKMMEVQQHAPSSGRSHANSGAIAAHNQSPNVGSEDNLKQEAMRYIGIQEAAQKLAAERLSKIGPDEASQFRSYYGYEKPARNRLSIRRGRNRASSNPEIGDSDSDDEMQSRRIRAQMSQLNKGIAQVDEKKREQDRRYLLEAAQRKVQLQMAGIDKKIYDETGKFSPSMLEEWDAKARARAAANSEARMENHGKVHIGHGKFMDQSEIDAIAQARMQPTLDEINEKTEKRLAEEEERRLELAEEKRQQQIEHERAAEIKAEEKASKAEEKKALKAKSAQEKAAEKEKKAEEKRLAKEQKRKSRDAPAEHEDAPVATGGAALGTAAIGGATGTAAVTSPTAAAISPATDNVGAVEREDLYRDSTPAGRASGEEPVAARTSPAEDGTSAARPSTAKDDSSTSPTSPTSPTKKRLTGIFSKFKRRSKQTTEPGFIGGATLRKSESNPHSNHESTHGSPVHNDIPNANDEFDHHSDVSSISADSDRGRPMERTATQESKVSALSEYEEARDTFNENLAPPPSFGTDINARNSGSPARDSKFHEVL
ncbi:Eisosome assembly protein [Paraconiothyrium brasiliense]|uniref:Eisosome assembly protein n=1 Tax=Paraconiothyrium brasiliense TaxID=300254 RepID=A0ABR3QUT5_9PLEO